MPENDASLSWMPIWVSRLGVPVWISDPDRRICFANRQAEEVLGLAATEYTGRRCYEVVDGHDESGQAFCGESCPIHHCAVTEGSMTPARVRIRNCGKEWWVRLLCIPLWSPEGKGPWLVHCALDEGRTHGIEQYLVRVAMRTRSHREHGLATPWLVLTRREREVLSYLARDLDPNAIAVRMHVSKTTVRNHVQHILAKTDAHSVQELVARYLLSEGD